MTPAAVTLKKAGSNERKRQAGSQARQQSGQWIKFNVKSGGPSLDVARVNLLTVVWSSLKLVLHFSWNGTCFFESTSIVLFVCVIYTDGHFCHVLTTLPQVDIWRPQVLLQEDVSVRYIFCFSLQQFQCIFSLRIHIDIKFLQHAVLSKHEAEVNPLYQE